MSFKPHLRQALHYIGDFFKLSTDLLQEVLEKLKDRNIFITGGGGVGKSYLVNQLKDELGKSLILTSSTGVSAVNISGQTIHSWAGIGIADKPIEQVVSRIKSNKTKWKELCKAQYLVIDEISMLNAYTLDYINEVLKRVRDCELPFGGIRVILVGDFFQLPPVKIGETENINGAERLIDYCFNSMAWQELDLETILLTKVWRQTDEAFINTLNHIREGRVTRPDKDLLGTRNFPNDFEPPKEAVRLYALNRKVDEENQRHYDAIKEKEFVFRAKDTINCWVNGVFQSLGPESNKIPDWDRAKYESFDRDCRVPKVLKLKVGCRVMLLKNISFGLGLVNGSCGVVTKLEDNKIVVTFDNGKVFTIETDKIEIKQGDKVKIKREQYPLTLAYSASIHKAQGATFDYVCMDCENIFANGQAYVGLSRARTLDGLFLKNLDTDKVFVDGRVVDFYENLKGDKNESKCNTNNKSSKV